MPEIKYNIIKNSKDFNEKDDGYSESSSVKKDEQEVEEDLGGLFHQWSFFEHAEHQRGKFWYIGAAIFLFIMFLYCIKTDNFLFLVIIIMSSLFIVMSKFKKPDLLTFSIYEDGLKIEESNISYKWDQIKEYYIIYDPDRKVKKIYFILNNFLNTAIGVDLENENPILIRETLNNYIKENTIRKYEKLSDQVERFFKL